jgi:hypothetical protein
MRRATAGGCAALFLLILAASAACSRKADDARPVATPSVTLSRAEAAAGSPVDMNYRFTVAADAPPFAEDDWVFVHFLDKNGDLMWTDDHQPPTPTTRWQPGAVVAYQRTVFVPKSAYVGPATVQVGLFSRKTGERLPLAGDNAGMRSYRVATFDLRLQADNMFVVFKDGWHDTEASDDGSGLEWQWSKKEGALSVRNPRREVVLLLQVDQPVTGLPMPQQVDVRVGPAVVDHFSLPPGEKLLRRIPISVAQLGTGDTVEMTIAVDRTFTPASLPQLKSSDARELGIRVFRAYIQPAAAPKN